MAERVLPPILCKEEWENFDAEALFPPPRLHTNRLTKVDRKDMQYVDSESLGEQLSPSGEQAEPQDGDAYTDAPIDKGHVDELFEMEGLEGGTPDDREIRADKEEDRRTQPQESFESEAPKDSEDGNEAQPSDGQEASEAKKQFEAEGEEKPIQKESEGVEEVVEATSKTSEDVHGGDEATKDIKDSPNAADDGQNPENKGAESGKGGDEGEGSDGEGQRPSDSPSGSGQGDSGQEASEAEANGDPLSQEDWEAKAEQSISYLQLLDSLEELEAKVRDEKGHRTNLPTYHFDREESPVELEVAFQKGRELIQKLAAEEDFTAKISGQQRWDPKALLRAVVSYRHSRISSSRYDRPREADIILLLDISGSCAQQAEMFMAIGCGAAGSGVRIYVGYNGSVKAGELEAPRRPHNSYAQAKAWVQKQVERLYSLPEWSFREFVEEMRPKTLVIFGDWDGIDQYQDVVSDPKFHSVKFFWFANEGRGRRKRGERGKNTEIPKIPKGWTRKNYFPGVYTPWDLVRVLRKLR